MAPQVHPCWRPVLALRSWFRITARYPVLRKAKDGVLFLFDKKVKICSLVDSRSSQVTNTTLLLGVNMQTVIAVGRHAFTIVGDTVEDDVVVFNSSQGADWVLAQSVEVIFVGNWRWALPMASYLQNAGLKVSFRKVTIEHGARGKLGSMVNVARHLRNTGELNPKPFFNEHRESAPLPDLHYMALTYLETVNEVRRVKHKLLNGLCVIFPEVVPQKSGVSAEEISSPKISDIFTTKRMAWVLKDPRAFVVMLSDHVPPEIRTLARSSLGHSVPAEIFAEAFKEYGQHYRTYTDLLEKKEKAMEILRCEVIDSELVKEFGDGDIIVVLSALLGDEIFSDWRKLRAFAGLALTRQEPSGKKRISRRNGAIRQYLYLFASLTKEGREMAKEVRENANRRAVEAGKPKATHTTVKVLEGVLKRMRNRVRSLSPQLVA